MKVWLLRRLIKSDCHAVCHAHVHISLFTVNLHVDSKDCQQVLEQMNCGQRCLLKGLINAAGGASQQVNVYDTASQKAGDIVSKTKNLRTTLGKLFNRPKVATTPDDNDDTHDFFAWP